MITCELCTGRHPTNRCSLGERWIEQCFTGTPPDYRPTPDNVVQLVTDWTYRKQPTGRAVRRYNRTKRDYEGVRVQRLG